MAVMVRGVLSMVNNQNVAVTVLSAEFVERVRATLFKTSAKGASDEVLSFYLAELRSDLKPEQLPRFRAELMDNIWPKLHRVPVMDSILAGWSWTCLRKWDFEDWQESPPTYEDMVQMKLLGGILRASPDAEVCFTFFRKAFLDAEPELQRKLLEIFRKHAIELAKQGAREARELLVWTERCGPDWIALLSRSVEQDPMEKALFQAAIANLDQRISSNLLRVGFDFRTKEGVVAVEQFATTLAGSEMLALRFVAWILPEYEGRSNPAKTPFRRMFMEAPSWEISFDWRTHQARVSLTTRTALSSEVLDGIRQIRDEIQGDSSHKLAVSIKMPIDGRLETQEL